MVEGLIAEGYTPAEVAEIMQRSFGMSAADADLYVRTALGLPGDVELKLDTGVAAVDEQDALPELVGADEDAEDLAAAVGQPNVITVQPIVHVTMPEQPAPIIHVTMPEQPATVVNVEPVVVPAPEVSVHVEAPPAPEVTVNVPSPSPRKVEFQRDNYGRIIGGEITEEDE